MAKLNTNVRFLVMNRTNQVIAPKDENLAGFEPKALKAAGEIPKQYSPSFKNRAKAEAFGAALAAKYPGERFYLSQVVAGCMVEPKVGPWVATGTTLRDDATAEDLDGEGDDLDDNE